MCFLDLQHVSKCGICSAKLENVLFEFQAHFKWSVLQRSLGNGLPSPWLNNNGLVNCEGNWKIMELGCAPILVKQ